MIILAIDPGIEKTGFAIVNLLNKKPKIIYSGLIKTSKETALENRLLKIYRELEKNIRKYKPGLIVIEQIFFAKNKKTAIKVSQAQGVILLLAGQKKIKTEFLTPLQIKQVITGYGNADKKSVQKMLNILLDDNFKYLDDDHSDAIACGLAYCYLNSGNIY